MRHGRFEKKAVLISQMTFAMRSFDDYSYTVNCFLCIAYLIAVVLSESEASHDLLIDEIGGNAVDFWVVPRGEDLFAEKQSPGGVALHHALLLRILLALRYRVHYVVAAAAQRRHLKERDGNIRRGKTLKISLKLRRDKNEKLMSSRYRLTNNTHISTFR